MGSSTEHSAFGRVKHPDRSVACAGRFVRRVGRVGGRRGGARGPRLGDRRLGAPAGELLRDRGDQAELWPGEPRTASSPSGRRSMR